jgi:acyl carrier protein
LKGEDPDALTPTTPLITGGIMDSLSNMKLVTFLEQQFDIAVEAHEISPDYIDTVEQIAELVVSKTGQ